MPSRAGGAASRDKAPASPGGGPWAARGGGSHQRTLRSHRGAPAPLLVRHPRQPLDLSDIQAEAFSHTCAILRIGLVEDGRLAQLDAPLGVAQVSDDVADQVVSVLVGHHLAIQVPSLNEIVVGVSIPLTRRLSRDIEGRLGPRGVRPGATETVWVGVGAAAAVGVKA